MAITAPHSMKCASFMQHDISHMHLAILEGKACHVRTMVHFIPDEANRHSCLICQKPLCPTPKKAYHVPITPKGVSKTGSTIKRCCEGN